MSMKYKLLIWSCLAFFLVAGCKTDSANETKNSISEYSKLRNQKFIQYYKLHTYLEQATPLEPKPTEILALLFLDKPEFAPYTFEFLKAYINIKRGASRVAGVEFRVADSTKNAIIKLGDWFTTTSMMLESYFALFTTIKNGAGEFRLVNSKFYDAKTGSFLKGARYFFIRKGIIVCIYVDRNVSNFPVNRLAKSIDDEIIKASNKLEKKLKSTVNEKNTKKIKTYEPQAGDRVMLTGVFHTTKDSMGVVNKFLILKLEAALKYNGKWVRVIGTLSRPPKGEFFQTWGGFELKLESIEIVTSESFKKEKIEKLLGSRSYISNDKKKK